MVAKRDTLEGNLPNVRIPWTWSDPWVWLALTLFFIAPVAYAQLKPDLNLITSPALLFLGAAARCQGKAKYLRQRHLQPDRAVWLRNWAAGLLLFGLYYLGFAWSVAGRN